MLSMCKKVFTIGVVAATVMPDSNGVTGRFLRIQKRSGSPREGAYDADDEGARATEAKPPLNPFPVAFSLDWDGCTDVLDGSRRKGLMNQSNDWYKKEYGERAPQITPKEMDHAADFFATRLSKLRQGSDPTRPTLLYCGSNRQSHDTPVTEFRKFVRNSNKEEGRDVYSFDNNMLVADADNNQPPGTWQDPRLALHVAPDDGKYSERLPYSVRKRKALAACLREKDALKFKDPKTGNGYAIWTWVMKAYLLEAQMERVAELRSENGIGHDDPTKFYFADDRHDTLHFLDIAKGTGALPVPEGIELILVRWDWADYVMGNKTDQPIKESYQAPYLPPQPQPQPPKVWRRYSGQWSSELVGQIRDVCEEFVSPDAAMKRFSDREEAERLQRIEAEEERKQRLQAEIGQRKEEKQRAAEEQREESNARATQWGRVEKLRAEAHGLIKLAQQSGRETEAPRHYLSAGDKLLEAKIIFPDAVGIDADIEMVVSELRKRTGNDTVSLLVKRWSDIVVGHAIKQDIFGTADRHIMAKSGVPLWREEEFDFKAPPNTELTKEADDGMRISGLFSTGSGERKWKEHDVVRTLRLEPKNCDDDDDMEIDLTKGIDSIQENLAAAEGKYGTKVPINHHEGTSVFKLGAPKDFRKLKVFFVRAKAGGPPAVFEALEKVVESGSEDKRAYLILEKALRAMQKEDAARKVMQRLTEASKAGDTK